MGSVKDRLKRLRPKAGIPRELLSSFNQQLESGEQLIPRIIHVETRTMCNGRCSFCAASIGNNTRADLKMENELIEKILSELESVNYSNRLSFYNNNEPFLDRRIFDIIQRAREVLPLAYLELKTNGRSIGMGQVKKIFNSGLDTLYINDYRRPDEDGVFRHSERIAKLKAELAASRRFKGHYNDGRGYYNDRIVITLRDEGEVLGTRAGSSPNANHLQKALQTPCLRPFEMMTIEPSGQVALCSEDLNFDEPMGNLKENSLLEIFNSDGYYTVRRKLLNGDRNCKSTCSKCSYRGFTQEVKEEMGFGPRTRWQKIQSMFYQ